MESKELAETIYQQMGGNRFRAMTGAKNFVYNNNSLCFRVSSRRANMVKITLDPSDTYTMEFWLVRGIKMQSVKKLSDVYCDMLQDIFEETTGLLTHF